MQKSPLWADEKLNSPLTSENLPRKKKNTSYFKYFGKEFPSGGRKNHPFSSKLERGGGFYNSSVWKAV